MQNTNFTPCTHYNRHAYCSTSFRYSNATNLSDNLAYRFEPIQRTDHATYTSTRLTLPTSYYSISTRGYFDIDRSSRSTSTHGRQSCTKNSNRQET